MDRQDLLDVTGDEELLFADGFDDAIVGVIDRCSQPLVVVYDRRKCLAILMERGMNEEQAEEYSGAWVGERTPAFLYQPESVDAEG